MPGVSFTQFDRVYITGYYFCESPTCGPLGPDAPEGTAGINMFVTLGTASGPGSSGGYAMDVEPYGGGLCDFTNDAGLIWFSCLVTPANGWGQVYDYVWLTVENGDSQVATVYIDYFSVDWNWSPSPTATPWPTVTSLPTATSICGPCLQGVTPTPTP